MRFGLIFFFKLPPPTEKMNIASFLLNLLTFNHSINIECQPSSLVLAVNSETLSVAEYDSIPTIFLKSLTACEQFPALPPTPKKNNRPLFFLIIDRSSASFSICSGSNSSMIFFVSSRCLIPARD